MHDHDDAVRWGHRERALIKRRIGKNTPRGTFVPSPILKPERKPFKEEERNKIWGSVQTTIYKKRNLEASCRTKQLEQCNLHIPVGHRRSTFRIIEKVLAKKEIRSAHRRRTGRRCKHKPIDKVSKNPSPQAGNRAPNRKRRISSI